MMRSTRVSRCVICRSRHRCCVRCPAWGMSDRKQERGLGLLFVKPGQCLGHEILLDDDDGGDGACGKGVCCCHGALASFPA